MNKLLVFIISIFLFFGFIDTAKASNSFSLKTKTVITFSADDKAEIRQDFTLTNLDSAFYAKSFKINFNKVNPDDIKVFDDNGDIQYRLSQYQNNSDLDILFKDQVIGFDQKRMFSVSYTTSDISEKTGDVWEISIPIVSNIEEYETYTAEVRIPDEFGKKSYISFDPESVDYVDNYQIYIFDLKKVKDSSITMGFGNSQSYSVNLTYHLENPLNIQTETYIALPPDTSFQKMYYTKIEPRPVDIKIDEDGNWLAKYILDPREKIDVNINGYTQLFSENILNNQPSKEYLDKLTLKQKYWETDNEKIISVANNLSSPFDIYNHIINFLDYDYERVNNIIERYGAAKTLDFPSNALCMEYTDLFVTLARTNKIPAREIQGYAYTQNPELEPISLVADVLHSWPEYWNKEKNIWVPIDPTWADTTKGQDYFNNMDLRHITFVIHGVNSEYPYPPGSYRLGSEPQKDVFVELNKLPSRRDPQISIKSDEKNIFLRIKKEYEITIVNNGPVAIYNEDINIYFDDILKEQIKIDYLLPFTSYVVNISIPFKLFAKEIPETITIKYKQESFTLEINRLFYILLSFVFILLIMIIILTSISLKFRKIDVKNIINKIKYLPHAKNTRNKDTQSI